MEEFVGPRPPITKVVIHQPLVICLTPLEEIHRQLAICEFAGRRSHNLLWEQADIDRLLVPPVVPDTWERHIATLGFLQRRLIAKPPHATVIEHANVSFVFLMSRIASHEFVRHRVGSPTQSSTRFIEEASTLHLVSPTMDDTQEFDVSETEMPEGFPLWAHACLRSVLTYHAMRDRGEKREQARYVLPHALATSIVHTTNLRSWAHMIYLRTGKAAAPEMQFIFGRVRTFLGDATSSLLENLRE